MTAKIKLNAASGGGSFSLQAPSSSSNNRVLTLPDSADGTIAKTSDIAFSNYAIIADVKSAATLYGGTLTFGAWRTRDLNTEITDPDGIVSISSNQFTLQAGTYRLFATVPAYQTRRNQAALYNITASSYTQYGDVEYAGSGDDVSVQVQLRTRFTIASASVFEIRHRCELTVSNYGMGIGLGSGSGNTYWAADQVLFTIVEIFKEV